MPGIGFQQASPFDLVQNQGGSASNEGKSYKMEIQCVTIENRQSPFYVVNRVTLAGKKLYQKSCWASELTICMLRGFRSFQKGTLGLCKSTGCKVTSCQSWRFEKNSAAQHESRWPGVDSWMMGSSSNFDSL